MLVVLVDCFQKIRKGANAMTSFIIGVILGTVFGMLGVWLAVITFDKKLKSQEKKLDIFPWLC